MDKVFQGLNEMQQHAVKKLSGPVLTLAGAGSGKTKVLTHRIAHLMGIGVKPWNIMAVTFTNKAANEMRERVKTLVGGKAKDCWVGTFHNICIRILVRNLDKLGYKSFTIVDDSDQLKLIKQVCQLIGVNTEDDSIYRTLKATIGLSKSKLETPGHWRASEDKFKKQYAEVYQAYQDKLLEISAFDFDDIILKAIQILEDYPDSREYYQDRFEYILVDEYQDINPTQYKFIKLISEKRNNIFVVGDADQCWTANSSVRTPNGVKSVCDLTIGDEVLSMVKGQPKLSMVTGKSNALIKPVLQIKTKSGKTLRVSEDHKCFATMPDFTQGKYFVYLMYRQDKGFRLGVLTGGLLGTVFSRTHSEKPERLWLLGMFDNRNDAVLVEESLSLRFQIPTSPFFHNGRGLNMNQASLDILFKEFGKKGLTLLKEKGYHFDYPHYVPQNTTKDSRQTANINLYLNGKKHGCLVTFESNFERTRKAFGGPDGYVRGRFYADQLAADVNGMVVEKYTHQNREYLNVIPANQLLVSMQMPILDGDNITLDEIIEITPLPEQEVYHVEVAQTGILIADDIVSHNSIYMFRGAEIQNILNFQKDFPDAEVIMLEQNYRSTGNILTAANRLIEKNNERLPKNLWTGNTKGSPIVIHVTENEYEEAEWIVSAMQIIMKSEGRPPKDFAVLYRTNTQSRLIEEALMKARVPYQVIGSLAFYERKEIKDAMAYLRIIDNQFDAIAFSRIINVPKRGIGSTTVSRIEEYAKDNALKFSEALEEIDKIQSIKKGSREKVKIFNELVHRLREYANSEGVTVTQILTYVLRETSYRAELEAAGNEDAEARLNNLDELTNVTTAFDKSGDDITLSKFLTEISLMSDIDSMEDEQDCVKLLTLHSAKGLEFQVVFMTGMEEELFPHFKCLYGKELEEERRLCYVGITRAQERLYLTAAKERRKFYGVPEKKKLSRFIRELPAEVIKVI